jgi:hypothetical protein
MQFLFESLGFIHRPTDPNALNRVEVHAQLFIRRKDGPSVRFAFGKVGISPLSLFGMAREFSFKFRDQFRGRWVPAKAMRNAAFYMELFFRF